MSESLRRHLLGVVALVLLFTGLGGLVWTGWEAASESFWVSLCVRCGITLGALWLAWPQLVQMAARVSPAVILLFGLGIAVVIIRPRAILFVGPLLLVLGGMQFLGWLMRKP